MTSLPVYIGYDPRDHLAYQVCEKSMRANSSIPLDVRPLREWECRQKGVYWRSYRVDEKGQMWDDRDGKPFSTQFSFTRFCIPALENFDAEWVLFCDADMMFRGDVAELLDAATDEYSVMCVKHDHRPKEEIKMDGVLQQPYHRKNWSSLMLMRAWKCTSLTKYTVNNWAGSHLHAMLWMPDEEIGGLDLTWNYLVGYNNLEECPDPRNVHFTLGTPDMVGECEYSQEWRDWLT